MKLAWILREKMLLTFVSTCLFSVIIADIRTLRCSDEARRFTEFHNGLLNAKCVKGCLTSSVPVKGSIVYTDDSSICKAAIHAGVINNDGGSVQVRRLPGRRYYSSTVHNGIKSTHADHWTHSFSFKFESTKCERPLGLRSHTFADRNFRSSGVFLTWMGDWHSYKARLDKGSLVNAWRPAVDDKAQWWQVDLGEIYEVRGIVTQGSKRLGEEQYIKSFNIQNKISDRFEWLYALNETGLPKTFEGNTDADGRVTNNFYPRFAARYLRLIPLSWKNHISLRAEVIVCD
ncbi:retinoschisin-like [Styela clava]